MEVEIWDGGLENIALKFSFLQKSRVLSSWKKERWWAVCSARLGPRICQGDRPHRGLGVAHSSSHWDSFTAPGHIFPLGGSCPWGDVTSPAENVSLSATWGQHRTADGMRPPVAAWSTRPLGRSPLSLQDLSHPSFQHPSPPQAPHPTPILSRFSV